VSTTPPPPTPTPDHPSSAPPSGLSSVTRV
jgi:hypothetical protein